MQAEFSAKKTAEARNLALRIGRSRSLTLHVARWGNHDDKGGRSQGIGQYLRVESTKNAVGVMVKQEKYE